MQQCVRTVACHFICVNLLLVCENLSVSIDKALPQAYFLFQKGRQMATLPKQIEIRRIILEKNLRIFSERDFRLLFDLNPWVAKYHLNKESKPDGLFIRLKKGLYTMRTDIPSDEEIANRLYQPSYISLETALSRYGIIPESVYATTSVTTKPTREFIIFQKAYIFTTINKSAYTGYYLEKIGENGVLIAEPEKALADYLYHVVLGNKTLNDRLYLKNINLAKLNDYVALYQRKSLSKLVNKLLKQ